MKKIVKLVLIILVVAACVAGSVYYSSLPLIAKLSEVTPKVAELYFTEQGTVVSQRVVDIYALTPGKIISQNVQENQKINVGDVICVVDSTQYDLQILQTESTIKGYEAQISNLAVESRRQRDSLVTSKNNLLTELKAIDTQEKGANVTKEEQLRLQNIVVAQSEEEITRQEDNVAKMELLYNAGSLPENDYINAKKAVENAKAALDQNLQQLHVIESSGAANSSPEYFEAARQSLRVQIEGIDNTMNKDYTGAMTEYYTALMEGCKTSIEQLKKNIEDCTVKSTVAGVITTLHIKDTNAVSIQVPVASITTEGVNTIEVYVSTNDIDQVTIDKEVGLILKRRGGDKVYTGKVTALDDEATVKMSALGVEERRVKVTITPDEAVEFKKGYDVDVKFNYYHEENKLTVPKTALFKENDQEMVWIVKDGKADKAVVKTGIELRSETVIESGLNPNDVVVTDCDMDQLKVGAKIKSE